jgi:N-acetylglucosaminyldiphosphoundecaprenol N-acetyl-beta-D-mannosaminyltransferase
VETVGSADGGRDGLAERVELAGVMLDRIDRRAAAATIEGFFADGGRHQIVTVNTDFIRIARRDADFRSALNDADLAVADGMPVVWLSRVRGTPLPERVAGIDLIDDCCRVAARRGVGIFLLGAAAGVAAQAARQLAVRHPGLKVVGTASPPFGPHSAEAEERMVAEVRAAGAGVLLVAFGAPRQDLFIARHLSQLDVVVAMGVGCAFDILAGSIRRAPSWMRRSGLEWVWRMAMEPGRLWRRYLLQDAPLLGVLAAAAVRDGFSAVGQRR